MRVRRAQDRQMRLVRQVDVVGVAPAPGEETYILLAPDRLADAEPVVHVIHLPYPAAARAASCPAMRPSATAVSNPLPER